MNADRDWPSLYGYLPNNSEEPLSVLHIGCGLGTFLLNVKYRHPTFSITGAESNPAIVKISSSYLPLVPFHNERIEGTEENRFDFIFITDTLEHLKIPELFIRNLKPLLKQNGHIILAVDNSLFFPSLATLLSGGMSKRGFPLSQLLPLFTSNGFHADSIVGTSISFDKKVETSIKYLQTMFRAIPTSEYYYQNYLIQFSLALEETK